MANHCKICTHPNLKEINERLIIGDSMRSISEDFGMAESSVFRHYKTHLPQRLIKAMDKLKQGEDTELAIKIKENEDIQLADSIDIIKKINFLITETEDIYAIARDGKQNLLALKSLDSLRGTYQFCVNMLAQMEATYQAKLEILRLQNGEDNIEAQKIAEQKLKLLRFEELQIHKRIVDKMLYDTNDLIIEGGYVIPSNNEIDNIIHI